MLCTERLTQKGHINWKIIYITRNITVISDWSPFQLTGALAAFWALEDRNKLVNGALMAHIVGSTVIAEMLEENKHVRAIRKLFSEKNREWNQKKDQKRLSNNNE